MALSLLLTGYSICKDQAGPISVFFLGRIPNFTEAHFPPPVNNNKPVGETDTGPTISLNTCLVFAHLIVHIIGGQLVFELLYKFQTKIK